MIFMLEVWALLVGIVLIIGSPIFLIVRLVEVMKRADEERRWREDAERRCRDVETARRARIESILGETDPDKIHSMLLAECMRSFDPQADAIPGITFSIVHETDRDKVRRVLEAELNEPYARKMFEAELYWHNIWAQQRLRAQQRP